MRLRLKQKLKAWQANNLSGEHNNSSDNKSKLFAWVREEIEKMPSVIRLEEEFKEKALELPKVKTLSEEFNSKINLIIFERLL